MSRSFIECFDPHDFDARTRATLVLVVDTPEC
jgi:hypothetical protein